MSDFFNKKNKSLQEAILGCIMCTMYSDGEVSQEDLDAMAASYSGREIFSGVDAARIIREQMKLRANESTDTLLRHYCENLTEEWKPAVYTICCDYIFKDRLVADAERQFLRAMKNYMELSDALATKITEVISWLYKDKFQVVEKV